MAGLVSGYFVRISLSPLVMRNRYCPPLVENHDLLMSPKERQALVRLSRGSRGMAGVRGDASSSWTLVVMAPPGSAGPGTAPRRLGR
jgi:hypothetical protein